MLTKLLIKGDEIGYISDHDDQSFGMFCPIFRMCDEEYAAKIVEVWNAKVIEAEVRAEAHEPKLLLNGQTLSAFGLEHLYDFQEATDCDTAEQYLTEKKEAQEPVATADIIQFGNQIIKCRQFFPIGTKLYTAPQLPAACPRCTSIVSDLFSEQHKVYALLAENDKLQAEVAEQIAEIERLNCTYEALDEQRNRDFETIAQQAENIAELESRIARLVASI